MPQTAPVIGGRERGKDLRKGPCGELGINSHMIRLVAPIISSAAANP